MQLKRHIKGVAIANNNHNTMKIKSSTRTQLAANYDVSLTTFNKWLKKIDNLNLDPGTRILSPKQVELIVKHLGEPEH